MKKVERKPNRLKGYNYSQAGLYFVTICTADSIEYFGKVENHQMILNQYGNIAHEYWLLIPEHYGLVQIDDFVVMPNHIHGIIIIEGLEAVPNETEQCSVATDKNYGLLSKIVKSYKDVVSKAIRRRLNDQEFAWQRSFCDHIIRNETALSNIRDYIRNNPLKRHLDRERANELSR
ncbi:MAG: transposase [Candidatus Zixiibacteriota bacterium]|nr:MAG: transposase [candidate division Zixibacteria bacterium]